MTTVRRPVSPAITPKPLVAKGITAADAATAKKLQPAIKDLLTKIRMTLTPVASQPKWDAKSSVYRAPDGHALFAVALETPPMGSADMFSSSALVDPVSNTFYVHTTGGFAGVSNFNGPLSLPAGAQFKGKQYSLAQLKLLAAAAVKAPPKPAAFHASPSIQNVSFSGGMGAQPPQGVYAGPSVNLSATFPNITYKPSWTVKLDEKTKTLTVVVDASEGNPMSKVMTRPVALMIPVGAPAAVGGTYTLLIKDYTGKVLDRSTFKNMLPV